MLTNRYDEALLYAHELHRTQTRKGTSIPYIAHLMTVSALVSNMAATKTRLSQHCARCGRGPGRGRHARRGQETLRDGVATIVSDCTDSWTEPKPDWRPRKEAYLALLPSKSPARCSSRFADKTHNAEAILFDYLELDDALWSRFNGRAAGTRWYYAALAQVFAKAMPGLLAKRLSRAVAGFAA